MEPMTDFMSAWAIKNSEKVNLGLEVLGQVPESLSDTRNKRPVS